MLKQRVLGNTGLAVAPIGLGTVKFGRNTGVKYPAAFELPSDAVIEELIEAAEAEGVNLIDTAPAYGTSEARVGRVMVGRRHRWVIATKVGERFEDGVSSFAFDRAAVVASVERSLRLLRIDCIDVVLVHSDGLIELEPAFDGTVEALNELKRSGKIRASGASTKTVAGGLRAVNLVDVVMVTINDVERGDEAVVAAAAQRGVGVFIKKAFASGHAPDAMALARTAQLPGVSSIVIGTLNPHNLRSNCRAVRAM